MPTPLFLQEAGDRTASTWQSCSHTRPDRDAVMASLFTASDARKKMSLSDLGGATTGLTVKSLSRHGERLRGFLCLHGSDRRHGCLPVCRRRKAGKCWEAEVFEWLQRAACMRASTVGLAMVKSFKEGYWQLRSQSPGLMTLPMLLSGLARRSWCAPGYTKHDKKLCGHCRFCAAQCRAAPSELPARTCVVGSSWSEKPKLLHTEVGPHAGKAVLQSAIARNVVKQGVKDHQHVGYEIFASPYLTRAADFGWCLPTSIARGAREKIESLGLCKRVWQVLYTPSGPWGSREWSGSHLAKEASMLPASLRSHLQVLPSCKNHDVRMTKCHGNKRTISSSFLAWDQFTLSRTRMLIPKEASGIPIGAQPRPTASGTDRGVVLLHGPNSAAEFFAMVPRWPLRI